MNSQQLKYDEEEEYEQSELEEDIEDVEGKIQQP